MSIRLRKWYLDAIDSDGRAVIVNWASVHIAGLNMSAASVLDSSRGVEAVSRTTLQAGSGPTATTDGVRWSNRRLRIQAQWDAFQRAEPVDLLPKEPGSVIWCPSFPAARVKGVFQGLPLSGHGYAETLELSILPWALPLAELRWGRFVSEQVSLVWLDWRGEHPLSVAFLNGVLAGSVRIGDSQVEADGVLLRLDEHRVLREGPIGTTALSGVPSVASWAPVAWLTSHERKALAHANVSGRLGRAEGWAIHEVVRFRHEPRPGRTAHDLRSECPH